jgi:excisionase family DNA binding protein
MEKTLFSTPELAEWLGVFHTTVRRWIERGRIRGIRVGRNYKIPVEEVIRILESHGIPLPEVVRTYRHRKQSQGAGLAFDESYEGSILRKLLIVEDIKDPAFICRKASILGANQAFAELVGLHQVDLIGMDVAEVVGEASEQGVFPFIRKSVEEQEPGKRPAPYVTRLKTGQQDKEVNLTASYLDHMKDTFLLVVKNPE